MAPQDDVYFKVIIRNDETLSKIADLEGQLGYASYHLRKARDEQEARVMFEAHLQRHAAWVVRKTRRPSPALISIARGHFTVISCDSYWNRDAEELASRKGMMEVSLWHICLQIANDPPVDLYVKHSRKSNDQDGFIFAGPWDCSIDEDQGRRDVGQDYPGLFSNQYPGLFKSLFSSFPRGRFGNFSWLGASRQVEAARLQIAAMQESIAGLDQALLFSENIAIAAKKRHHAYVMKVSSREKKRRKVGIANTLRSLLRRG